MKYGGERYCAKCNRMHRFGESCDDVEKRKDKMKRIKKVEPELLESMFGKITCPHCGKTHGVDLNVLSMLCKHCGNPIKLMWENKVK